MPEKVRAIPESYHSLTPVLSVKGAAEAIAYYKRAFDARELMRHKGPDGRIIHAELKIGDSVFMLGEECPDGGGPSPATLKGTSVGLYLYVPDADAVFAQALRAGGKTKMALADMFWGDRCGQLSDPFGHVWSVATHKEDVTPEQLKERAKEFFAQLAKA